MNGTGPPLELNAEDYSTVKTGTCITSGMYAGCILVGEVYHWFAHDAEKDYWVRHTGSPENHAEMTAEVWALCQAGGEYAYNAKKKGFIHNNDLYRWKPEDGYIALAKL